MAKSYATAWFSIEENAAAFEVAQLTAQLHLRNGLYQKSLEADRVIAEQLKENYRRLGEIRAYLLAVGGPRELRISRGVKVEEDSELTIVLTFSREVSSPQVSLAGVAVPMRPDRGGGDGSVRWVGQIAFKALPKGVSSAPLSVALPGTAGISRLDRNPATPAQINVSRLIVVGTATSDDAWSGFEPGADTNHDIFLKSGAFDPCLIGTWRSEPIISVGNQSTGGAGIVLTIKPNGATTVDYSKMTPMPAGIGIGSNLWQGTATGRIESRNGAIMAVSVEKSDVYSKITDEKGAVRTYKLGGLGPIVPGGVSVTYRCEPATMTTMRLGYEIPFKRVP
jgi:hypothetical protein